MRMRTRLGATLAALVLLAACTPSPQPGDGGNAGQTPPPGAPVDAAPPGGGGGGGGGSAGPARIQELEAQARRLARTEGCTQADQCRTAPVGSRPCGGPREYLVYCAASTDSAALFRVLDELARAEEVYNREQGLVSTCEFRMPPGTELSGRTCRATTGGDQPM